MKLYRIDGNRLYLHILNLSDTYIDLFCYTEYFRYFIIILEVANLISFD